MLIHLNALFDSEKIFNEFPKDLLKYIFLELLDFRFIQILTITSFSAYIYKRK